MNHKWKATIALISKPHVQPQTVYVEAPSLPHAKDMLLAIYSGYRIVWGPVQVN